MNIRKIIKIVILLLIVLLLVIGGIISYRYFKYKNLDNLRLEYLANYKNSQNSYYKMKVNVNNNDEESYYLECFYKDGIEKIKSTKIDGSLNNQTLYNTITGEKTVTDFSNNIISQSTDEHSKDSFIFSFGCGDFWKNWALSTPKIETVNNKSFYIVHLYDEFYTSPNDKTTIYIDVNTGVTNKITTVYEDGNSLSYELVDVKFDSVTDSDIAI